MHKFTGGVGVRFNLCFMLALGLGCFYFTFLGFTKAHNAGLWAGVALFFLLSSWATFIGLYGLLESFTTYEIGVDGVTRRGWNGTKSMRWLDVARVDVTGQRDSQLTLCDNRGQKLAIERSLLGSKRTAELNALLEPYLAPVRERQLREVGGFNSVYYPRRNAAWAGAILLVMMVPTLVFLLSMPIKAGEQGAFAILMALMGAGCLFALWMTISFHTQTLTVTQHDLTDRTLFRTRQIPFHHVGSVSSRMVQTKNGSFELTTIEGDGQKIAITSQMKDYDLLREYIRQHANDTARAEGEAQAQEATAKVQKQQRVLVPILAFIYFAFFIGFGVWEMRTGQTRLERYRLMDAQGQTTTGRVTGLTSDGPKGARYLLHYAFTDETGAQRESASPVSWQDYQTTRIGLPVRVTYVPGRKDMCTIAQSTGRRKAEGDIRTGWFNIALAFVLPPLLIFTTLRKKKTASTA